MKIAITADVHLGGKKEYPERYNALENLLKTVDQEKINTLIIAGDLFDETYRNFAEFDKLASKYEHVSIHIIPGNHDMLIDDKAFTANNVIVYTVPTVKQFDISGLVFFLVPYQKDLLMGEVIASSLEHLPVNKWILIGHGDWESGIKASNPHEPGVYMPLSSRDIASFKPAYVFLGHIHKPMDEKPVCYPGSPCGLDITETGRRRFIVFDTENQSINPVSVDTDALYFSETFSIYPIQDEESYIRSQIKERTKSWGIREQEKKKVKIRIKIRGYSSNKKRLNEIVEEEFRGFTFYDADGIDLKEVFLSENYEQEEIARKTAEKINMINWPTGENQPTHDDILFHALQTIYGVK